MHMFFGIKIIAIRYNLVSFKSELHLFANDNPVYTMNKIFFCFLLLNVLLSVSCGETGSKKTTEEQPASFGEGEFGCDLAFLEKQDSTLVLLKTGEARLIVSPRYQAKVFTSTALGDHGISFGWINYRAFGNKVDSHMNAYGGENRLWLGPEGGKYSLFFKPGSKMIFENWKTPAAFDMEGWNLRTKDSVNVILYKEMSLENYAGTRLKLIVERSIRILDNPEILRRTGIPTLDSLHAVGYETDNVLTNLGDQEWTAGTGMPCIWILDMLKPSPSTVIVVPFRQGADNFKQIATTNYFGEIAADRIKHKDSLLLFKADGKSRGKLGIVARHASEIAGSYDSEHRVLTIILFDVDGQARYLNQEWNITKPSFSGDAANAYNDGPLADGTQMGPFYEIESVSPAAFLKPGASLRHRHSVIHFTGSEGELNKICSRLLGVSLEGIRESFPN